jgi:hypothetical protein
VPSGVAVYGIDCLGSAPAYALWHCRRMAYAVQYDRVAAGPCRRLPRPPDQDSQPKRIEIAIGICRVQLSFVERRRGVEVGGRRRILELEQYSARIRIQGIDPGLGVGEYQSSTQLDSVGRRHATHGTMCPLL